MKETKQLDIINKVLELSSKTDNDDCIVTLDYSNSINVRFSLNHIISSGDLFTSAISVISIKDKKVGVYNTQDFDESEESLKKILEKSIELRNLSDEAYDYTDLISKEEAGNLNENFSEIEVINYKTFETISSGINRVFDFVKKDKLLSFGYVDDVVTSIYLGTSKGIRKYCRYKKAYLSITLKSEDFKKSLWKGVSSVDLKDEHFDEVINFFGDNWKYLDHKIDLPAGKYEVILSPTAAADMLAYRHWLSDARSADEGRSLYSDKDGKTKLGQKLVPDFVNIYSDPDEPFVKDLPFIVTNGSGNFASIFDNGAPASKTYWIKEGILTNLIYTRHWAKKNNVKNAPLFQSNILMEGSEKSIDDLIKTTKKGLLLNALWYIRLVDPTTGLLTGLTRDGVFVIEDGKIVGVCNNFRWNVSPQEMLSNAVEISESNISLSKEWGDEMLFTKTPAIKVKNWNMSTSSEAV